MPESRCLLSVSHPLSSSPLLLPAPLAARSALSFLADPSELPGCGEALGAAGVPLIKMRCSKQRGMGVLRMMA